jgi:HlyD family secretion protein
MTVTEKTIWRRALQFRNKFSVPLPGRAASRATLAGLLASAVFLAACSKPPKEQEPVVTVQIAAVEQRTIHGTIGTEAVLFPLQQAAIVPKISAPVRHFYVNRGARVHAGELLAELENNDLAAAAQEASGSLAQAEAGYQSTTAVNLPEETQKAKADVESARQILDAEQKIHDSRQQLFQQGAIPRKDWDQSVVALTQARNQYEIAEKHLKSMNEIGRTQELKAAAGQLGAAKGHHQGAQAQLSYSQIRSPIDGVVTDRPLFPGEMAAAGTALITVMDVSQVIAKAHIPQQAAAQLKVADPATISVPGLSETFPGKVTVVSPALDPNSTTVEIWVQAGNPGQRLKPGSSVRVSIITQTVENATVVPAAAVLTAPDGASVMVVGADQRAHERDVKVGVRDGDTLQITAGLKPGEKIVTLGAYALPDNTQVQAEAPKPAGGADKKDE